MERDTLGRIIIGDYAADTLTSGVRVDTIGAYSGDFSHGLANGHGCAITEDGTYYEGQWKDDHRHGFGFAVTPGSHIRVGEWKADKFLGERMSYTSERIYGIDISRYQHGKGRKTYPILWDRLRISYLGYKNQRHATGTVDYPVSFVFIKSTASCEMSAQTTLFAPAKKAFRPKAPVWLNASKTFFPRQYFQISFLLNFWSRK